MTLDNNKTDTQQAKAAEVAQEIKDGKPLKGSEQNPVQVATEDLKVGKEENEAELREKTAHVGRIASEVIAEAKENAVDTKDYVKEKAEAVKEKLKDDAEEIKDKVVGDSDEK